MIALAARAMGYRIGVWEPSPTHSCHGVADWVENRPFDDPMAAQEFAQRCAVVTLEFENVPSATANRIHQITPVRPGPDLLRTAQNRVREKSFLRDHGFPVAPFAFAETSNELDSAIAQTGLPAIAKTAESGYDGKGQWKLTSEEDVRELAGTLSADAFPLVVESMIQFEAEWSILVARHPGADPVSFPPVLNEHRNHILDISWSVPSMGGPDSLTDRLRKVAHDLARAIDLHGLMAVETFVTSGGGILVNEIAPRPHNSGHYTMDGASTSQFEQVVRSICGLPMGETATHRNAAMVNLLGDLWSESPPPWEQLLLVPGTHLHLYGKDQPRPGRKMGHINLVANTPDSLRERVRQVREILQLPAPLLF